MAYIKMINYQGQILRDMNIEAPAGITLHRSADSQPRILAVATAFYTTGNNRLGIARYKINMINKAGEAFYGLNYEMSKQGWTLLDPPYTPEMIEQKYGYKVAPDGTRLKKYKLTGRVRAQKMIQELISLGRLADAERMKAELQDHLAAGKRYWCNRADWGLK